MLMDLGNDGKRGLTRSVKVFGRVSSQAYELILCHSNTEYIKVMLFSLNSSLLNPDAVKRMHNDRYYQSFTIAPEVTQIFGIDKFFCILLRPNNHIAFVSEHISVDELKNYHFFTGDTF